MLYTPPPESKRILNVGADLDGCYYLFDRAWWEGMAATRPGWTDEHPYQPATRWEFYLDYGVNLGEFLASCHDLADEGLLWACDPIRDAAHAWWRIAGAGHRIHVKTDRSFGSHPLASQIGTRQWLRRNGLHYETLTFTADKTAGPDVDIMLEDKLSNYDELEAAGVNVWLIDRAWNQDPGDSRRRLYSLDEFVARVNALAYQPAPVPA